MHDDSVPPVLEGIVRDHREASPVDLNAVPPRADGVSLNGDHLHSTQVDAVPSSCNRESPNREILDTDKAQRVTAHVRPVDRRGALAVKDIPSNASVTSTFSLHVPLTRMTAPGRRDGWVAWP